MRLSLTYYIVFITFVYFLSLSHPVVALLWHSSSMKVHWWLKKIVWQRNGRNLIWDNDTMSSSFWAPNWLWIWIHWADSFHCYWTAECCACCVITRKTVMRISPAIYILCENQSNEISSTNLLIIVKWKLPTSLDGLWGLLLECQPRETYSQITLNKFVPPNVPERRKKREEGEKSYENICLIVKPNASYMAQ